MQWSQSPLWLVICVAKRNWTSFLSGLWMWRNWKNISNTSLRCLIGIGTEMCLIWFHDFIPLYVWIVFNALPYYIRSTVLPSPESAQRIYLQRLTYPLKMVGVICFQSQCLYFCECMVEWMCVCIGMHTRLLSYFLIKCYLRLMMWVESDILAGAKSIFMYESCDFFFLHPHTREGYTCGKGYRNTILKRSFLQCDGWGGLGCVKSWKNSSACSCL